jgi:hypothetical protein
MLHCQVGAYAALAERALNIAVPSNGQVNPPDPLVRPFVKARMAAHGLDRRKDLKCAQRIIP